MVNTPCCPNLVSYIEKGEIRPLLAKTFPLERIADAQREFTKKKHVGKFVLLPPALDESQEAYFDLDSDINL
jgi:NADPH:quinone reductase-like Zn-dependent oxidoreductase